MIMIPLYLDLSIVVLVCPMIADPSLVACAGEAVVESGVDTVPELDAGIEG
jgi:hypothetical protein